MIRRGRITKDADCGQIHEMNVIQAVDRAKGCVQSEAKCCSSNVVSKDRTKDRKEHTARVESKY